jgi:hypothetical protein
MGMGIDETLIEPFQSIEYYVDGFTEYAINQDGILSCTGFRLKQTSGGPLREVVLRIVMPVSALPSVIGQATAAASEMGIITPVLMRMLQS